MAVHRLAGTRATADLLIDVARLEADYYAQEPDLTDRAQRVSFGTSGHRGSSLRGTFTEAHVLAITQAICNYRMAQRTSGPLFIGKDTHALSDPAFRSALEVLAANGVDVMVDRTDGYTPTPAISHAILAHNRGRDARRADGIVVTPSHNPPDNGGFKYNTPDGGPADSKVTSWIETRANALLAGALKDLRRVPFAQARHAASTHEHQGRHAEAAQQRIGDEQQCHRQQVREEQTGHGRCQQQVGMTQLSKGSPGDHAADLGV